MSDLDTRGRAAADGLRRTVDQTEFHLTSQVLGDPTPFWRQPWMAFVGGVAVAATVLAVLFVGPLTPVVDDVVTAPTSVTTVGPDVTPPPSQPSTEPGEGVVPSTAPEEGPPATDKPTTSSTVALDLEPPFLEITDPIDGSESEEARIEFRGTTEPGARVLAGSYEADVDDGGAWSIVLLLSPGENRARFVAIDEAGNETEAWVTVSLVVPETTTTTKPAEETTTTKADGEGVVATEFKVFATYYESSTSPSFEVYYGTGKPGTVVEFISPYGSGRAEIDTNGTFETRVTFSEVPLGEKFTVVVESSEGHRLEFPFKRVEG